MEPHTPDTDLSGAPVNGGAPQAAIQPQPIVQVTAASAGQTDSSVGLSVPTAADDADTIEAAWIEAVRNAVRTYQGDPYNLSTAIAMLRREYLSKRYGKDLEQAK